LFKLFNWEVVVASSGVPDLAKLKKMAEVEGKVYQFKISLEKLKPPLWRRVLVPGTLPLNEFHKVILCLFGWDGDHCHKFNFRETKSAWGIGTLPYHFILDFGPKRIIVVVHVNFS